MFYLFLKFIHILSSTLLFGTGIGTAFTMVYGNSTRNVQVIAATTRYVVLADWMFTATSGVVQPLTGLWMVHLAGYAWSSFWVVGSILGYCIAGACWVPVVFLQMKMRDYAALAVNRNEALPAIYFRYFKYWFCLGWPAFISLLFVFYFMTNKPAHLM